MNITLVIADLGSGGAQKILCALAEHWLQSGHTVTVLTLDAGEDDFFTLAPSIQHISLNTAVPSSNFLQGVFANINRVLKIRRALRDTRAEHVVSFIAPTNILCIFATMGLPLPLIISERNDPSRQSFGRLWDFLRRGFYRFADTVTVNSHVGFEALQHFVPADKLSYIPNHISAPDRQYCVDYDAKEPLILGVGRLHPQKGFDVLLHAFAIVHESHPDWRLAIVGHGDLEAHLKSLCHDLGLDDVVTFTGGVENSYAYYARAKIFALPSRHEGTPNALLEALSCGVAAVVSDAAQGAFPYVREPSCVFSVDDPDDLARALMQLITDENFMRHAGETGKESLSALSPETVFEHWDALL